MENIQACHFVPKNVRPVGEIRLELYSLEDVAKKNLHFHLYKQKQ